MSTPENSNPPAGPARRRLHQLPGEAQEWLVALSWTSPALRSLLEHALGRVRGNPVRLQGSDADVLASLRLDLAQRNAISEALHRQLGLRHTLAVQRLAAARQPDALHAAWNERPENEAPVATLWALLTHTHGAALQDMALRELRLSLAAQARSATTRQPLQAALQARVQALQAEADTLRQRLLRQQAQSDQALQAANAALAQARGKAAAAAAAALRDPTPPCVPRPAMTAAAPMSAKLPASPPASPAPSTPAPPWPRQRADARAPIELTVATPPGDISPVQGQRVLCVGGIQHAVARYRSRVESLGGRFEHHDGGLHDNAHALDGRLARADLVICQAGCINHSAYHRIKQHCQRTGKPCLYLERASLSRFDRALQTLPVVSAQTAGPAVAGPV